MTTPDSQVLAIPGFTHVYSGKVRDLYAPDGRDDQLLLVTRDALLLA